MIFCIILILLALILIGAGIFITIYRKYDDKYVITVVLILFGLIILIACYYNYDSIISNSAVTF